MGQSIFCIVWSVIGVGVAFLLGTLIGHVMVYGWFTPVP